MVSSAVMGAVVDLAAAHHGVVTRRQAAESGLLPGPLHRLIERGFLVEPAPGVLFIAGAPRTYRQQTYAASLLTDDGAINAATAAWLHQLDGVSQPVRSDLCVERGVRPSVGTLPIRLTFTRTAFTKEDTIHVDGIRVTSVARTIVDLAAHPKVVALERLVDDFERRDLSLTWLEQTATRLRRKGRSGPAEVLREVERRRLRRARSERVRGSWFQRMIADCLRSPDLPGLVEEHEIRDSEGRLVARCDLAMPLVRLGIEAHSRRFHDLTTAEAYDERRDNRVAELGWDLRYVGWADTQTSPARFRAYVERLVARRAADFGIDLATGSVRRT